MRELKIAAAAYPLDFFESFADYEAKLRLWVYNAAHHQAQLLVFPEYGAMELGSLGGRDIAADLEACLHEVARWRPQVDALHLALAAEYGVHILGASGPAFPQADARPVNRATLYGPGGIIGHQDKQIMTRFERETWSVRAGDGLQVFDTDLGRIGVLICYDSEFPLLARSLAEAGAEILLVPSCTDSLRGYSRVRVGSMARALENQCIVVQAPTVGPCDFCPAVDENIGAAAIYGPPDLGFPETGVFAETPLNEPGWAYATIAAGAVAGVRREGGVLNFLHWDEQAARIALAGKTLS